MATKKKQKGRLYVILLLIASIIIIPSTFQIMSIYGEKSGVEFSPDDFTFRRFDYCKLPWVNWTRRGIKYTIIDNGTASMLTSDDWIRPNGRTPQRWHLVSEKNGSWSTDSFSKDCDARFLTSYFDKTNSVGVNRVVDWTDQNPVSAKVFWPLIADLARENAYLQIPEVMEFALNFPKPDGSDSFEFELGNRVSEAWYQSGLTSQLKERHERAIRHFDNAVANGVSGHTLASEARKKSLAAAP